ncbi:MAG TPA: hypothetical protein PKN32_02645, partial [Bacteroidales bacterium]|nr:hypothetical protein [Bacteroidales bacterium]
KMLSHLEKDPALVDAYVEYSLSDKEFAWRAAWVIHHYSDTYPENINKYADKYIKLLPNLRRDGYIREVLRILYNLNLNEPQICEVYDICSEFVQNNKVQSSVRAIAFQFIIKVASQYPELQKEIKIIFENIKDYLSPGIRSGMEMRLENDFKIKK